MVDHRSGLLGISGIDSDIRRLREVSTSNANARLAVQMFCYSIRKQVAAMIAALDGVVLAGLHRRDRRTRCKRESRDLWRLVLDRRQPRRGSEQSREQSHQRSSIALLGARSHLAGRRADRPPYLGIVTGDPFLIAVANFLSDSPAVKKLPAKRWGRSGTPCRFSGW